MELQIFDKSGKLKITVSPDSSSTCQEEVMGECCVSAAFTTYVYITLDTGDYVLVGQVKYTLHAPYKPVVKNKQTFVYSVKFYAPIHDAQRVKMLNLTDNQYEPEFVLDGGPRDHLQKWVDNMNRVAGENVWSVGTVISAPNKTISYKALSCWDAAFGSNGIAETFDTEMWADGTVINLCKAERNERIELGYLQGLTSLTPDTNGDLRFFTRLFPLGPTRNIDPEKYGYSRLQLPSRAKFVDKNVDLYGIYEDTEESAFSGLYPQYTGKITAVRSQVLKNDQGKNFTVYYFKDAGMQFDPSKYEIAGLVKQVTFVSGELNGREFEANWHPDTEEWEIINVYLSDDVQIPGGNLIPAVGDKYIPWNFRMPDEYVAAAEQAFAKAVDNFLENYSVDTNKYGGDTDFNYIRKNNISLVIGQNIRLLSTDYFKAGYRDTRITKIVRKLNNPDDMAVTCTDKIGTGWKTSVDNRLDNLKYILNSQSEQGFDIIKTTDRKSPSDNNVYSALKSDTNYLFKNRPDTALAPVEWEAEQHFNKGLTSGDTIDSFIVGKGTLVTDNGRIQTDRVEVRQSMTVMDLIINQIQGMASDFEFTDVAKVSSVEKTDENTCKLTLEKKTEFDVMLFRENDIIRQVVNTIPKGGAEYYTSWMRIVSTNSNDNSIQAVLYPDSEVPGGKNYAPVAGYNIGRRGNAVQKVGNERAGEWYLSSLEGRIAFLMNVFKPVLEKYNYGTIIGDIPEGVVPEIFTEDERKMAVYARNLFVDRAGFHQIDYNGNIVANTVFRGEWSLDVARSDSPYRNITREYEATDNNKVYTLMEQHTVTHFGCTWGCIVDETLDEPSWNSQGWVMLEGDPNYYITILGKNTVLVNHPDQDLKTVIKYGNRDITNSVMATSGTEIEWLRDTGIVPEDNAWRPAYIEGRAHNEIRLSYKDMGSEWGVSNRNVTFICRIWVPIGGVKTLMETTYGIEV